MSSIITLPGFIDIRCHIRKLDTKYLDNIDAISAAAISSGITMIFLMSNTYPQVIDEKSFIYYKDIAKKLSYCDYGLYFGGTNTNYDITCQYITDAASLEIYLGNKYNKIKLNDMTTWLKHLLNWPKRALGPIVCYAEEHTMAGIILLAHLADRPIHISDVKNKNEILLIKSAKDCGIKVTCDICPHHLFITRKHSNTRDYKFELCSTVDQKALWDNLNYIDIFATGHTGYSLEEKRCYKLHGIPTLETTLPLLLNAIADGRLKNDDLIKKLYKNPKRIFNIPDQPDTYITVDLNEEWIIPEELINTKIKWTPFAGWKVKGKILKVYLRGKLVYKNGKIFGKPGYGKNVRCESYNKVICSCEN